MRYRKVEGLDDLLIRGTAALILVAIVLSTFFI